MSVKVSFIIPSYNSAATLPKTVESVLAQKGQEEYEVIIVDSSDDADTKQYLRSLNSPQVRVIDLDKKTMPAIGRNIGAGEAKGGLLCFVDSDIVLTEDWLGQVMSACQNGCRAGGGSVDIYQPQAGNALAWAQLFLQFNETLPSGTLRPIGLLPACNMFCERGLFLESGGFPKLRASEDVVLSLNLAKRSKLWFVPQARAYHIFRESKAAYRDNQKMLGQYILTYRRDYLKSWYCAGLWPFVFLPAIALIKLRRIGSRIPKDNGVYRQKFGEVMPLFLYGFWAWVRGFAGAVFSHREGI